MKGCIILKMNLKFLECKKGIGTMVGLAMGLLIIILFMGGTFLWQVKGDNEMNKLDKDWFDEQLILEATHGSDITVQVMNNGALDIRAIRFWIIDHDHNDHQNIPINYAILAGDSVQIVGAEIDELTEKLTNPLEVETGTYSFKIVTDRGNIFTSMLDSSETGIISDYLKRVHGSILAIYDSFSTLNRSTLPLNTIMIPHQDGPSPEMRALCFM